MRLLYISARYPPHLGGTELHTYEVATEMARRDHSVTVVTTDRSSDLPVAESRPNLDVVRVPAYPRSRDYYMALSAKRFVTHEPYDLIHIQGYHTALAPLALRWLRPSDVPHVLTFHSGGARNLLRKAVRPLQYSVLRRGTRDVHALVAVSEFERELFANLLKRDASEIDVIRNGVSRAVVGGAEGVKRNPNMLITAGRLERYKGHHLVVEAMPAVLRHNPDARLRVVGTGSYEPRLRELAAELGVADAVEFSVVEQEDRAGMGRVLAEASVALFLSDYEAEGIGAAEAHAVGCHTIVANSTALKELTVRERVEGIELTASTDEIAATIIDALAGAHQLSEGPASDARHWPDVADDLERLYKRIAG